MSYTRESLDGSEDRFIASTPNKLRSVTRGRLERVYPQLVYHFSQGDVPDKTVEYGLRLARAAMDAFSAEEAARSTKTALEFLDEEWEGERSLEGEARLLLAEADRMAGDIEGALREVEASIKVFDREKLPSRAVRALELGAETAWQARRVEDPRVCLNAGHGRRSRGR